MPLLTVTEAVSEKPWDIPLTIGLAAVLVLVVIIAVIRKAISNRKRKAAPPEEVPAPVEAPPTAPGSTGQVMLHDVEPKIAAMLMAIVADKLGKPLNELRFISIQEVEQ